MNEEELVFNRVRTVSSGQPGRAVGEVRQHFFVVDDPTIGESMTAADYFVSGVAACASNHMELKAHNEGMPLQRIEVELEARRDRLDTSVFLGVDMDIVFYGIDEAQAHSLLEAYKSHCPLYKTVSAVVDVVMTSRVVA
jgi:uncharacterized OsmC-like protein